MVGISAVTRSRTQRSIGAVYRSIRFFYQEHDARLVALGDLHRVARLADQVRNVNHRQRIGAVHFELIARLQRFQRLARFQGGQRAFQPGEIKRRSGCALVMGATWREGSRTSMQGLEQIGIGQETHTLARLDPRDVFAEFDQAIGLDQ